MARTSTRDKLSNEINAGSMADIAFLLLIFFLVTTTIDVDKGILVKLPPWSEEEPDITKLKKRNVFSVLVNANNQLLVRGEPARVEDLRERAKDFILNPTRREDLSENPKRAIISLKNDRGTKFGIYLEVYNELKAAYAELWTDLVRKKYPQYDEYSEDLPLEVKKAVRGEIPFVVSEAEPTAFGEE